jgi:hypothetical protein
MATIEVTWKKSLSGRVPYLVLTLNDGDVYTKRINSSTLIEVTNFETDKEAKAHYESLT